MALTKATYSMIVGAPANVRDFGAVGDGVTDDTDAFKDALAVATVVYVPPGIYLITDNISLDIGRCLYGHSQRFSSQIVVSSTSGMTGAAFYLADSSSIQNLYIYSNTASHHDPNVLGIEGLATAKWLRISNCFSYKFWFGIKVSNYYHTISDCQTHSCGYGIAIGDASGDPSGAVTLIGNHMKDCFYAGLYTYGGTNSNNGYSNTFEFNRVHIDCNGQFNHFGGYLSDVPVSVVTGLGRVYINNATEGMDAGAGDNGAAYGLNLITTDYGYAVRIADATIENAVLAIASQVRSDPVPGSVYRGSVLGQGKYTLNNVFFSSTFNTATYVLEESSTIPQQISEQGVPYKNYVNNGLFLDGAAAANPLYITNTAGVKSGITNAWGGSIVLIQTGTTQIRWTVPVQNVGKPHLLIIYSGVTEAAGALSSGPGLNFGGSTNMTFSFTQYPSLIGSEYVAGTRALIGGINQSGRITIGQTVCVATPTATTGILNLAANAAGTWRFGIYGIVLTPKSNTTLIPIGWFNTPDAVLI
tara:strand:+ start:1407 stop:2993 length:1587 start_codon:yes stop_codon:yes gene_type:complete